MMRNPRKRAPKRIAVIDPERCFGAFSCSICQAACPVDDSQERCFGAFSCSICQAACPVDDCIIEEKDADDRWVCAVRVDKCIGCGLCVTLGNPTAPQPRDFGCPADYDAINMHNWDEVVDVLEAPADGQPAQQAATPPSETTT